MSNPAVKRYILPFSTQKSTESNNPEIELAAVYALAELEREKGGGLLLRQPEEKLLFISRIGYPLWLYPNREIVYIFDGLNNTTFTMRFPQLPEADAFIENLEKKAKTQEDYLAFLSDSNDFFQQTKKEKEIKLAGLIVYSEFKKEFSEYNKEAKETIDLGAKTALLSPILERTTISSTLSEINKLKSFFKDDYEMLPECLRLLDKTTSKFITELNYAEEAANDEINAKIKAQEELVNPQIVKLNSQYKHQISNLNRDINAELDNLEKLKTQTIKLIEYNEEKIKLFNHEAQTQAQKKHFVYEKRWKEKSQLTKKDIEGLKRTLNRIENNVKKLTKQEKEKTHKLHSELENEIRLARQPITDLEIERDAKSQSFKLLQEKLFRKEKPIIEGLRGAIRLAEGINAKLRTLGFEDSQVKTPALLFFPFYVACYQAGYSQRCIFLAPSITNTISFSAKFRSVLGISKIKQIFSPRFKTITALVKKAEELTQQNSLLDNQITSSGEKNNLLKTDLIRGNIVKGLSYLKNEGWLSENEYQTLNSKLAQT